MKRLITILMALFVMGSAFAYTPKAECFKVTKNKIVYAESFEPAATVRRYSLIKKLGERSFVISKRNTIEDNVEYYWKWIEVYQDHYKQLSAMLDNVVEESEEQQIAWNHCYEHRNRYVIDAVNYIPFITESNLVSMDKLTYKALWEGYFSNNSYSKK